MLGHLYYNTLFDEGFSIKIKTTKSSSNKVGHLYCSTYVMHHIDNTLFDEDFSIKIKTTKSSSYTCICHIDGEINNTRLNKV